MKFASLDSFVPAADLRTFPASKAQPDPPITKLKEMPHDPLASSRLEILLRERLAMKDVEIAKLRAALL